MVECMLVAMSINAQKVSLKPIQTSFMGAVVITEYLQSTQYFSVTKDKKYIISNTGTIS